MMKKIYSLTLALATAAGFAQASEPFAGTGAVSTHAGWATHSGTAGQLMITTGSLTYSGLNSTGNKASIVAGQSEDINLTTGTALTGTVYYSAIINVTTDTGLTLNSSTGDYFLMTAATAGTSVTAFSARLYVRAGATAGTFNLGILNNSGGTAAPTFAATNYPVGTSIFVVVKNDLATNTSYLFVNPAIGSAEGTALVSNNTGTTAAPAQIAAIAIREAGTAAAGTGTIDIDELRIGSTWAFVTSANLSVEKNNIAGLQLYPNPVTGGTLNIATDAGDVKEVAIFDVLGKQVVKTTTEQTVNVSNLKTGIYMVRITEAGKTATRKLVIK